MSKFYNTFDFSARAFCSFLSSLCSFLPKTLLNIMPEILTSMILASSCVTNDISLNCKGDKFDFI